MGGGGRAREPRVVHHVVPPEVDPDAPGIQPAVQDRGLQGRVVREPRLPPGGRACREARPRVRGLVVRPEVIVEHSSRPGAPEREQDAVPLVVRHRTAPPGGRRDRWELLDPVVHRVQGELNHRGCPGSDDLRQEEGPAREVCVRGPRGRERGGGAGNGQDESRRENRHDRENHPEPSHPRPPRTESRPRRSPSPPGSPLQGGSTGLSVSDDSMSPPASRVGTEAVRRLRGGCGIPSPGRGDGDLQRPRAARAPAYLVRPAVAEPGPPPGPGPTPLRAPPPPPPPLVSSTGLIGVRVSDHPVAIAITKAFGPITTTSASLHGGAAPAPGRPAPP